MKAKIFCLLAMFFVFVVCSFGVPKIPEKKPPKISLEKKAVEVEPTFVQESNQIVFDDVGVVKLEQASIYKTDFSIPKAAFSGIPSIKDTNPFVPNEGRYRSPNIRQLLHPPLAPYLIE